MEKWLLNANKDMDVRLGMTASILDEIFNDPNLPDTTALCAATTDGTRGDAERSHSLLRIEEQSPAMALR